MIFTVVVCAGPETPTSNSALLFSQAVLRQNHKIQRIFFLNTGVINASCLSPLSLCAQWESFINENDIDAVCCVGSAAKHGLTSEDDTKKNRVRPGFHISGLGQLIESSTQSDRLLTFGSR